MICLSVFVNLSGATAQTTQPPRAYKFTHGNWFDGKRFVRQTFYSSNGVLTKMKPAKIDESVDLQNGFVIPLPLNCKIRSPIFTLKLKRSISGGDKTGMWMLNYDFPYLSVKTQRQFTALS